MLKIMKEENKNKKFFIFRYLSKLRNYFLAGIVITAPIGITLYVSYIIINFVDERMRRLLPNEVNPDKYLPFDLPGLGILIVFLLLTFIGFIAAGLLGRVLVRLGERIISKVPVVRSIYSALKQIFQTVLASSSESFREVVLIEYPRKGLWAIAFITGKTQGEVKQKLNKDLVNIFLPTTPNPTSGFLLFVPKSDLLVLDMTIEEGIKMVISGGIVTPPYKKISKKN